MQRECKYYQKLSQSDILISAIYISDYKQNAVLYLGENQGETFSENYLMLCFCQFPECQDALGMETGAIPDEHIRASSEWDEHHAAVQGRLYFKSDGVKQGAWSAQSNDVNQWLQVDLGNQHTQVTGVASQGRNGYPQWVTKYKLQYSHDGVNFYYYKDHGQSGAKVR